MSIKKIPVNEIESGMYLVGIDISWMKSPFYKHRFMLSEQDVIDLKKIGCKLIDIDTVKSRHDFGQTEDKSQVVPQQSSQAAKQKQLKNNSLAKELGMAKKLENESKRHIKAIFKAFNANQKNIDIEGLGDIVNLSHDSVLRNGHALLSLFHNQPNGDFFVDYAFNTMSLALLIGQRLDMSDQELLNLGTAALVMDVGWMELSSDLFKLGSKYTDEEFNTIKEHVDLSVKLLEELNFNVEVIDIVAKHHERTDGTGYYNYCVDDIPVSAQILSLADHYNSQVLGSYDSQKVIPATALRNIYSKVQSGSHNTGLIELLIQLVGVFPISSAVLLNTREKAVVTKVNWRDSLKPTVNIFYNRSGESLMKPIVIDLSKQGESQASRLIQKALNPMNNKDDPAQILGFLI